jgi:polyisoprenoid-binding protein YceI
MNNNCGSCGLLLAALALPLSAQPSTYVIDAAHSAVQFSVRHMMVSNTRGEFRKFEGRIVYDPKNPAAAKVETTIDAASIDTHEARRDADLRSAEFFDVAKHPTITFKSKQAEKSGDKLLIKGDLTMRGVTKEVTLTVEGPTPEIKDPRGNIKIGASATTKVNRKDFGLVYNQVLETGGVLVGDEVTITLDIEARKSL